MSKILSNRDTYGFTNEATNKIVIVMSTGVPTRVPFTGTTNRIDEALTNNLVVVAMALTVSALAFFVYVERRKVRQLKRLQTT